MKWKIINIFRHNGTSEKDAMLSYECNSKECRIITYPIIIGHMKLV